MQKPVVCAGTWWNKYTVYAQILTPKPHCSEARGEICPPATVWLPWYLQGFQQLGTKCCFAYVILPVSSARRPKGLARKAWNPQAVFTHSDFQSCSKSIQLFDYWRAKHCCDAASQLSCIGSLCCVTDTHCTDRGRVAIFFGFISQEFYVFLTYIIRLVEGLRHKSPGGRKFKAEPFHQQNKKPKLPLTKPNKRILYLVHSKARNMVLKIIQLNAIYKLIWFTAHWSQGRLFIRYIHFLLFPCSMRSLVICMVLYLTLPTALVQTTYARCLTTRTHGHNRSLSEWPLDVLCYCCSFLWTALFPTGILPSTRSSEWTTPAELWIQLQNEQGSCTTAAPDLIFPLPPCWEKVKVNSCWIPKFRQWLIRPLLMDPLQLVMIPTNTAIIVCHVSMKMCICDPPVQHLWLWFCFPIPTLWGGL